MAVGDDAGNDRDGETVDGAANERAGNRAVENDGAGSRAAENDGAGNRAVENMENEVTGTGPPDDEGARIIPLNTEDRTGGRTVVRTRRVRRPAGGGTSRADAAVGRSSPDRADKSDPALGSGSVEPAESVDLAASVDRSDRQRSGRSDRSDRPRPGRSGDDDGRGPAADAAQDPATAGAGPGEDGHPMDGHTPGSRPAGGHVADGHITDGPMTDGRIADGGATDCHTAEGDPVVDRPAANGSRPLGGASRRRGDAADPGATDDQDSGRPGQDGPGDPDARGWSLPSQPLAQAGELERALAEMLAFLRRRITGDYEVDDHGFDPDLTEHAIAPLLRPVYRRYFRVETRGLENIPDTGGALVVSNHSGTLPLDAMMTALAILDHHPAHRHLRMLAADLVFAVPFLAPLARKTGNTSACQADAERLLAAGHLVGVWPEGFKGIGKPFSERYKLQRFGRGGFVSAALRTGVPIIPCTVVGAEEIYPMIGNLRSVARLLGLPYVPITPTFPWLGLFGLVPLPSKWIIEFGEPVGTTDYTPAAAEDPMLVFELTDRVRETIQHALYGLLMQRRSVFF